jgi:hypothetical protein
VAEGRRRGRRIDKASDDFDVADTYGVLFDLDASREFVVAVAKAEPVRMAFIVTDDDRLPGGLRRASGAGRGGAALRVVPDELHDQHAVLE